MTITGAPIISGATFLDLTVASSGSNIPLVVKGQTMSTSILSNSFITNSGSILSGNSLTNLDPPINDNDAASKVYVDSIINGFKIKEAADVATTNDIILSGIQTIDGYLILNGNRILVKNQLNAVENGIYIADIGPWSRSSDMLDGSSAGQAGINILNGNTQSGNTYICTNVSPNDIVGIDSLEFTVYISGIVAGEGLSKDGNVLNVNVDDSTIEIVSDTLQVKNIDGSQIIDSTISNSKLVDSSITINTNSGISGGSNVSLGSSITLSTDSTVVKTSGIQSISGPKIFTDNIRLESTSGIYTILRSNTSLITSYIFTFPVNAGSNNQALYTNGTGNTFWQTPGDIIGPGSSTNNAVALFDSTSGKLLKNSVVIVNGGTMSGITTLNTQSLNINNESISGQRLLFSYDSIGLVTITSSYQTLIYNVNTINDSGYSNSSGEITITSSGVYEINYNVQIQSLNIQGGTNATITAMIEKNTVEVPGSSSSCFLTEANGSFISTSISKNVILSITANDVIRIRYARTSGTTTCQTKPGQSSLCIKRLRP